MAKTEKGRLIWACVCGFVGLALLIASFSTENWISATIKGDSSGQVSNANHGLFTGSHDRSVLEAVQTYKLYVTCLFSDNVCAWSCRSTSDERQQEVEEWLTTGIAVFNCVPSVSQSKFGHMKASNPIDENEFMQAGLWMSTIVFMSIAVLLNAAALMFHLYNIQYNPIEVFASTKAVFFYYAISAFSTLLALILWGAEYGAYTSNNIAILDTLVGNLSSSASLDWSYYLLIPAEISQLAAAGLIYYRQYIIDRKDAEQVIKGDDRNNDANTFMY